MGFVIASVLPSIIFSIVKMPFYIVLFEPFSALFVICLSHLRAPSKPLPLVCFGYPMFPVLVQVRRVTIR